MNVESASVHPLRAVLECRALLVAALVLAAAVAAPADLRAEASSQVGVEPAPGSLEQRADTIVRTIRIETQGIRFEGQGEEPAGVVVLSVRPDSPAAAAGLEEGDVIVAVASRTLAEPIELDRPVPALSELENRFLQHFSGRADGEPVPLEVIRAGEQHTLVLETAPGASISFTATGRVEPGERRFPGEFLPESPDLRMRSALPLDLGLLHGLDEELGRFFGRSEGVVVLRGAGEDGPYELRTGDVILAVGGEAVTEADDARSRLARLSPYDEHGVLVWRDGEEVRIHRVR